VGAIFETLESRIAALDQSVIPLEPAEQAELDSAEVLMNGLFPDGKSPLIARWSVRYGIIAKILSLASEETMRAHITRLNLTVLFSLLDRVHKLYGETMGYTSVAPSEDSGALSKWHAALEKYLAAVIYSHQNNRDLAARLTAPYDDLAQAVRKSKRRGGKPAVDEIPQPLP
jgi:hypothetical protein